MSNTQQTYESNLATAKSPLRTCAAPKKLQEGEAGMSDDTKTRSRADLLARIERHEVITPAMNEREVAEYAHRRWGNYSEKQTETWSQFQLSPQRFAAHRN